MSESVLPDPDRDYDPDSVLVLAGDCGRLVLENGGETYRAEECMSAIAAAYGGREIECFATPTGAMFSMSDSGGKVHTLIIRIKRRAMDMGALVRLNDLKRGAQSGALGYAQARGLADDVACAPRPKLAMLLAGAAFVAAFFCLLFGGGWREAIVSGIIGMALKASLESLSRDRLIPDFFLNSLGGAISASLAAVARALLPSLSTDPIIIGVLMLLVPGVIIVNAIRDLMSGDLVAGVARAADAFVSAAAISLGTALALKIVALIPGGAL
jgi:uncharacterized membrane protein YjjP (DUF1212 family)